MHSEKTAGGITIADIARNETQRRQQTPLAPACKSMLHANPKEIVIWLQKR